MQDERGRGGTGALGGDQVDDPIPCRDDQVRLDRAHEDGVEAGVGGLAVDLVEVWLRVCDSTAGHRTPPAAAASRDRLRAWRTGPREKAPSRFRAVRLRR